MSFFTPILTSCISTNHLKFHTNKNFGFSIFPIRRVKLGLSRRVLTVETFTRPALIEKATMFPDQFVSSVKVCFLCRQPFSTSAACNLAGSVAYVLVWVSRAGRRTGKLLENLVAGTMERFGRLNMETGLSRSNTISVGKERTRTFNKSGQLD